MEIVYGIALAGTILFIGYNSIQNSNKIKAHQKKIRFYEALYKKHFAGKAVNMKNSPDPTDGICPEVKDSEIVG